MATRVDHDAELERALTFDEPFFCEGKAKIERFELTFADKETIGLAHQADFVKVLAVRSEPAPFGDGTRTRTDPGVRAAMRLKERERVRVTGFDPSTVTEEIAKALSPRWHLEAKLTDVLVYEAGGHFASHRDTPMEPEMIGTLVVALPIAYEGGAFVLDDGSGPAKIDMHATRGTVRWVAFFGDVDHVVEKVASGHRVTLAYRLTRTKRARDASDARVAPFGEALAAAIADPTWFPDGGELCVPCARRAIVEKGKSSVPIDALHDVDRELADQARARGLDVDVVPIVAAAHEARKKAHWLDADDYAQLKRPLTEGETSAFGEILTFAREAVSDEDDDLDASSLEDVIASEDVHVVSRARARSSLIAEGMFSATGYFGNEYYEALLYAFVALRLRVPSAVVRGVAKAPKPARAAPRVRVVHAKFGEGDVLAEEGSGDAAMVTVAFASGTKKLLKRFVKPA
jgi:hypothetical protein